MAERRPLVLVSGEMRELPSGDAVAGVAADTPDVADALGNLQGEADYTLPAGQEGDQALVERIGLFVFRSAATDPVDGETCIAPASGPGRWLLICPSWEFVYGYLEGADLDVLSVGIAQNATDIAQNATDIAQNATDIATRNTRALFASASLNFPSIAASGTAALTMSVPDAAVGDPVALALPSTLPAYLLPTAIVSAADTVSITLFNTASGAVDPAAMTWGVAVIKEV